MAFCPQCGAPTQPGMSFCVACGANLPAPAVVSTTPGVAVPSGRPVGKMVAPWKTVVLPLVTLGVYVYVFWWRVAREVDAYAGTRASPLVRSGVLLLLAGLAVVFVSAMVVAMPLVLAEIEDPSQATDAEALQLAVTSSPSYLAGVFVGLAGNLLLWTGLWRVWKALEADERARAFPRPIAPAVLLALLALGPLVQVLSLAWPPIGAISLAPLVALLWVIQHTQSHLNATWVANGAPSGAG